MSEKITILVTSSVLGPRGQKLVVGRIHEFDDEPYVRILIKSGAVELIDPPSLDYIDNPAPAPAPAKEVSRGRSESDPQSGRTEKAAGGTPGPKGSGKKSEERPSESPVDRSQGLGGLRQQPLDL